VSTSFTIADIFFEHLKGKSFDLNRKKPISACRAKKMWSLFLMWNTLPKTQRANKSKLSSKNFHENHLGLIAFENIGRNTFLIY
jgi:hypothetical protein